MGKKTKCIIAEIKIMPWGVYKPVFYCINEKGEIDEAISSTLLDLIEGSSSNLDELCRLVAMAEQGVYATSTPTLPEWSVDGINVWFSAPMARPGYVCITNENSEFSTDNSPQHFSFNQFRLALSHWKNFLCYKQNKRKFMLLGYKAVMAYE